MLAALACFGMVLFGGRTARAEGCVQAALEAERSLDIPPGLLLSIALVESGQGGEPDPWAMNMGGRSIHADSLADAKKRLFDSHGRLRAKAAVGCMQLSVSHHRAAFRPLEKILDPQANVWYAARFLSRLREETGSWNGAVARYNGGSLTQTRAYQCKIWRTLVGLNPDGADAIDARRCGPGAAAAVTPRLRRAFQTTQTAAVPR